MRRKAWPAAAALLALVAATGGAVATLGGGEATSAAPEAPVSTAKVQRGRLSAMVTLSGTLTYRARPDGAPYSLVNQARGTYTGLPEEGDEVACGEVLYRVDERPVLLLCGAVPAYRDLHIGDRGRDVRQLNRNLHALGCDRGAGVDVRPGGGAFTWRTRAALRELQHDRGSDVTGALALGDAVFQPESLRIADVSGELGGPARPGGRVARATSGTLTVQVSLDASQQGAVRAGDRAQITLPGNRSATGRVQRVGNVARAAGKDDDVANATVPATISLDRPARTRGLDRAPVSVDITTEGVPSALSVPVTALVGKAGGGFAVETVRDGGRRGLVAVKLGLFDTTAGRVEVEGALDEGDAVVVPSS